MESRNCTISLNIDWSYFIGSSISRCSRKGEYLFVYVSVDTQVTFKPAQPNRSFYETLSLNCVFVPVFCGGAKHLTTFSSFFVAVRDQHDILLKDYLFL